LTRFKFPCTMPDDARFQSGVLSEKMPISKGQQRSLTRPPQRRPHPASGATIHIRGNFPGKRRGTGGPQPVAVGPHYPCSLGYSPTQLMLMARHADHGTAQMSPNRTMVGRLSHHMPKRPAWAARCTRCTLLYKATPPNLWADFRRSGSFCLTAAFPSCSTRLDHV
jgi:hypothetical protein